MRADALNSHFYPVGTEMTGTKQITILHICSTDESESEEFLVEKTWSWVFYTDRDELKSIIFDIGSTEWSESECVLKKINKEKYENNESENEEPTVIDDPIFVNETIF